MIREDRELLAELARLNSEMASLGLRVMDGSASPADQRNYAERLIAAGERFKRRADRMGGAVIEGELVTAAPMLRQHHVNQRGQCRFCRTPRWRFWYRRRRCTVYRALDHARGQSLDVLWWTLFEGLGWDVSLEEVREWITQRRSELANSRVAR